MAGMPAKKPSEKLKTYKVSAGYRIGDNDNAICEGGDDIELTAKQAKYMQNIGAIFVPITEDDDEEDDGSGDAPERPAATRKVSQTH